VWTKAWDLYNGIYDWSHKAAWQSRVNISLVRQAVDRASAAFRRSLVRMRNFFGIEAESKVGYQQGIFTKSLLDYWFDRANFVNEFTTALKVGLITSTIVLKVFWEYCWEDALEVESLEEEVPVKEYGLVTGYKKQNKKKPKRTKKLVGKLGLKAVDPFKFWVVPGSEGRFVIEQTEATIADLEELAKQGIYDSVAVARLVPTTSGVNTEAAEEADRKGEATTTMPAFMRTVKLYHYWGDIYEESGKVLMRDATFTVVGEKSALEVIRKPRRNPLYHGRAPYVVGTPYIVPFSTYHRGIVEDVSGVATMITEFSNLIADGAMFDAIKSFEVDIAQMSNMSQAADGVYPGKVFWKDSNKNMTLGDKKMVQAIDVGKTPQEALGALQYFDAAFQKGTAITEFTAGYSGKGDRTATEVSAKTSQALEGLDDAARTVEETVIEPLLDISAKTIYQFHSDYLLPRLTENFPQATMLLGELTPAERYVMMVGGFSFKARGISVMLDKARGLEQVTQFLQIASHIPGILQRMNVDAVLEEIVMGLGWNPQKMLINAPASVQVMGPAGQQQGGVPFPPPGVMTPAQQMSAQMGAEMGGAPGNPMANNQESY
jgi:hypothetical protein